MLCFSGRILIGAERAPGSELRVTRRVFVNPSRRRLAKALRSRSFLTIVSVKAIFGSGFMVSDFGAQTLGGDWVEKKGQMRIYSHQNGNSGT